MKKRNTWEAFIQMIYIVVAQLGILFSVTETFGITYNKMPLYVCIIVLAVVLYILSKRKRYGGIFLTGGIILAEIVLILWKRNSLFKEIKRLGKTISTHMEAYVHNGDIVNLYESQKFTIGLLCILILTAGIVTFVIVRTKRAFGIMALLLIIFSVPFMAGEEPDAKTLVCVGVLLVTAGFSRRKGIEEKDRGTVRRLGVLIGIFSVIIGGMLFQPTIQKGVNYTKRYKTSLIDFWENKKTEFFAGDTGVGGANGGELGRVDRLEQDDKVHLRVTVGEKPKDRMYLIGFIGETYTGHEWEEISGYEDTGMFYSMMSKDKEYGSLSDTIEIEYIDANKEYDYQPYGSSLYGGGRRTITDKQILKYYPYDIVEKFPNTNEVTELEEIYGSSFVDRYKTVSREVMNNFSGEVEKSISGTDIETITEEISELFRRQTEYSLHPGKTPEDRDFAEYFFFENRKGYCTHYATVATLFFRMKGIPARYVAGYMIESGEFEKQKDGKYTAVVTGRNAHAWTEAYHWGGGWLPVETTPGYAKVEKPMGEDEGNKEWDGATSEMEELPQQEKPSTPQQEEKKEEKKKENEDKDQFPLPLAAGVLTGVTVTGGIVAAYLLRKKKKTQKEKTGYNEEIQELFHQIYRKLVRKKKISGNEELNQEFVEKICSAYPNVSREIGEEMLDIVYRANYGKEQLKKDDYLLLKRIFLALEKEK